MRKILVAEDEQNIREFVVINLERAGYKTYEAETGDQALALYAQEDGDFDVAVLDIMMPGEHDGLAVCKELRRRNPSIGIILLSARTQEMDKVSGLMMGADDYVTKPFSPSELVARVDAVYRLVALAAGRREGGARGCRGQALADVLRACKVECEYAGRRYVVLMFAPDNLPRDYGRVRQAIPLAFRESVRWFAA